MKNFKITLNKNNKYNYVWLSLLTGAFIIAIISVIQLNISTNKPNISENNVGYVEGEDYSNSNITTYIYEHEVIHDEKLTKAVEDIESVVDYMLKQNTYIRVQVGETDFDYYIYNKQGECLAQASDGSTCVVFRKDDYQSIAFGGDTGNILLGNDADILTIISNVLKLAKSDADGITTFYMVKSEESDSPETTQEYRVEIVGDENFKEIYNSIDTELGQNIVDTLKEQVAQISENEFTPHVIYTFLIDTESKAMSVMCQIVVDGYEHSNWILDGYLELGDWSLSEDWYSDDFSTLTSDEAFNKLNIVLNDIQSLINSFMNDNNIPVESEEVTEESITEENNMDDTEETIAESENNENTSTDNVSEEESLEETPSVEE